MYSIRFPCQILKKFDFSRHIFKNSQIKIFMITLVVGAELFHADRRTERRTWRRAILRQRLEICKKKAELTVLSRPCREMPTPGAPLV